MSKTKTTNQPPAAQVRHINEGLRPLAVPIDSLHPDPRNARKHDAANLDAIEASLREFGQLKPVVADAKGKVLAGNGTLAVGVRLGWKWIAAVRAKLDKTKATGFALADNRAAELAEWDQKLLDELIPELQAAAGNLADDLLLADLLPEVRPGKADDDDDAPKFGGATALARASKPWQFWRDGGYLKGRKHVLDFGAGQEVHEFVRYDAYHLPDPEPLQCTWDAVVCNYVFNVQPADHLIVQLALVIKSLLKPDGVALVAIRKDTVSTRGSQRAKTAAEWQNVLGLFFDVELVTDGDFYGFVGKPRKPKRTRPKPEHPFAGVAG